MTKLKALSIPGRQSASLFTTTYRPPLHAIHRRTHWTPEVKRPNHHATHFHIVPRMGVRGAVPPWRVQGRLNLYVPWPTTFVFVGSMYALGSGFTRTMSRTLTRSRSVSPWHRVWVCGRWFAGIAGSNPTGDMGVCLLWVLYVLSGRGRTDHSPRLVLPNVVCLSAIINCQRWGDLYLLGLSSYEEKRH